MTSKTISDAITNISTCYIEKAADYTVTKKAHKPVWLKCAAMAACLCLVVGLGVFHLTNTNYEAPAIVEVFFNEDTYIRVNPDEVSDIELQSLGLPEEITDDMIGVLKGYATAEGTSNQYEVYEYAFFENDAILILRGVPADGYSFIVQEAYHQTYAK